VFGVATVTVRREGQEKEIGHRLGGDKLLRDNPAVGQEEFLAGPSLDNTVVPCYSLDFDCPPKALSLGWHYWEDMEPLRWGLSRGTLGD
jgi:hypothetical protein